MFKKTNKKGFTLIELIIVVAIMAVLVALLAPNVMKYLEKSRFNKDISTLDSIRVAIEAELMDDDLVGYSTITDSTEIKYLSAIAAATGEGDEKTYSDKLGGKLFKEPNNALDPDIAAEATVDSKTMSTKLVSKAAKNGSARIAVYIDGKGGVAVAAIDSTGNVVENDDGKALVVLTKVSEDVFDVESSEDE